MRDVIIYATRPKGILLSCSVCVDKDLSEKEVEEKVRIANPTAMLSKWEINEKTFQSGEQNGHLCDHFPDDRRHYLLTC